MRTHKLGDEVQITEPGIGVNDQPDCHTALETLLGHIDTTHPTETIRSIVISGERKDGRRQIVARAEIIVRPEVFIAVNG